jgi:integrase
LIVDTVVTLKTKAAALAAIKALKLEITSSDVSTKSRLTVWSALVDHFRQVELAADTLWRTLSTRVSYEGYLRKWIVPRWRNYKLANITAVEVESWLRQLALAPGSKCKIRNLMSVIFNHAIRHGLCDRNPITFVRQSAKRRAIPNILTPNEIERIINTLGPRERTLVFLAAGTGLRMGELFAIKWKDVDFSANQMHILRSIVKNAVGPCKTEASRKPVPLHSNLAKALEAWRERTPYTQPEDWVFASDHAKGKFPYSGPYLMRRLIRPAAIKAGVTTHFGWHTFRHTYSSLLKAEGTDLKVVQELLRHSSIRVTMDTYTQAMTSMKRDAQSIVVGQFSSSFFQQFHDPDPPIYGCS